MIRKLKEINDTSLNALIIFAGVFCIVCSVMNFSWFFGSFHSRPIVFLLGQGGARIFYFLLGILMLLLGVVVSSG
ncbi:MAG: immunity 17 family protein [Synergistaceae bacterium]|nr:immunity 17 family protein [Synergistaceae bacterium]